jgi:acyl-CoA thioester hydrolase
MELQKLSERTEIDIHFYDVDLLNIVWHGNYVKYLENGREAFGKKYGIAYMDIYNNGYITPIVDLRIRYKGMVALGEFLTIETIYVPTKSSKLIFDYVIYRKNDMSVIVEASSTQLFLSKSGEIEYCTPDFYQDWKNKWNV